MIGIPLGLFTFSLGEWLIHKYVLHGLGKDKRSVWAFHFHEHHRETRRHHGVDPTYATRGVLGWHAQGKEALALVAVGVCHLPLLPVAPCYTATIWYSLGRYYRVHKRSHQDPQWARAHVPWHYDHHMGPDQDQNWGVTRPWIDDLLGTRQPFVGTAAEARATLRRVARGGTGESCTCAGCAAASTLADKTVGGAARTVVPSLVTRDAK